MGKHIIDKITDVLIQLVKAKCAKTCSTGCKTSCSRKLAHNMGSEVSYIIPEEDNNKIIPSPSDFTRLLLLMWIAFHVN